jgi:hypothetical protein
MNKQANAHLNTDGKQTFTPVMSGLLQRACACGQHTASSGGECEECKRKRKGMLQRAAMDHSPVQEVPPVVHDVLRSPGQPLDAGTRAFMEPRFGQDFSNVRVHTDVKASESARAVNALAYTVGHDVVFATGQYAPKTNEGRKLIAHELTHVVQQNSMLARQADSIPAPPLNIDSPALVRARTYNPPLPPRVPRVPPISPPPIPEAEPAPQSPCPPLVDAQRDLRSSDIIERTTGEMQRQINLRQSRESVGTFRATRPLIQRVDRAIRNEFGRLLPAGRNLASSSEVSIHSPTDFAALRVPNDNAARRTIGEAALRVGRDRLRSLCITDAEHRLLRDEVVNPIFQQHGINFVRDYELARTGGQTGYVFSGGRMRPHVDIPGTSRFMGHVITHEAMHYYVHDTYERTAESSRLWPQLMEGGAEFLARHVINQSLATDPEFLIHTGTYADEFSYVRQYLLRGGLSSFALAYFQGHVDLLGLTPPLRPKLAQVGVGDRLEREADQVSEAIVSKDVPGAPQIQGEARPILQRQVQTQTPRDRMIVERARRRLEVLNRFVDEWTTREARRLGNAEERDRLLERRRQMDLGSADVAEVAIPGQRARIETQNLANLNRRPLNIEITDDEVRFTVNFHVRFEDANMRNRFDELRTSLQGGIGMVWNQRLGGTVFAGRRFHIIPRVTQVAANAARDLNYWLITVRPRDNSPVTYPGCTLDQPPAGVTAAVTDSQCAGGVMNLPPAAIADSSVIGHELLHLFGLVDRYIMLTQQLPGGRSRTVTTPTRETRGRPDPLGGESGTILAEDLAFLFDRLGIYTMEASRGLDVLRQLEQRGLSIAAVRAEIHRLEEIIRLGRDPNSLIREREDFNDRMRRDVENLD